MLSADRPPAVFGAAFGAVFRAVFREKRSRADNIIGVLIGSTELLDRICSTEVYRGCGWFALYHARPTLLPRGASFYRVSILKPRIAVTSMGLSPRRTGRNRQASSAGISFTVSRE